MKKRTGFVSNSSSSSFVCDICGREESGWELCISDVDMVECINGHIFCIDEQKIDKEAMIRKLLESESLEYSEEEVSKMDICEIKDLFDEEWSKEDWGYECPEDLCPICQFNNIIKKDGFEYLLKKNGIDEKQLLIKIKEEFKTYKNFKLFLKDKT